jgi:hypothetical protein
MKILEYYDRLEAVLNDESIALHLQEIKNCPHWKEHRDCNRCKAMGSCKIYDLKELIWDFIEQIQEAREEMEDEK